MDPAPRRFQHELLAHDDPERLKRLTLARWPFDGEFGPRCTPVAQHVLGALDARGLRLGGCLPDIPAIAPDLHDSLDVLLTDYDPSLVAEMQAELRRRGDAAYCGRELERLFGMRRAHRSTVVLDRATSRVLVLVVKHDAAVNAVAGERGEHHRRTLQALQVRSAHTHQAERGRLP